MSDTQNYVEWRPEYDGHAPPYWREGMACNGQGRRPLPHAPAWLKGFLYCVPPEALTAPNEEAKPDGRAISGALSIIRAMSPEELAKHGIALAPEKDVFAELADELKDTFIGYWPMLLRTRFEQMKGEA